MRNMLVFTGLYGGGCTGGGEFGGHCPHIALAWPSAFTFPNSASFNWLMNNWVCTFLLLSSSILLTWLNKFSQGSIPCQGEGGGVNISANLFILMWSYQENWLKFSNKCVGCAKNPWTWVHIWCVWWSDIWPVYFDLRKVLHPCTISSETLIPFIYNN